MDGLRVKYWEGRTPPPDYYETPDPYKLGPKCNINLSELTKYARESGKRIIDMTYEEIQTFAVENSVSSDLRDAEKEKKDMSNMDKKHDTVNSEGSAEHTPDTVQTAMEESEDDAFCLKLYEQYLVDQDNRGWQF